jgi:hypothetical protein
MVMPDELALELVELHQLAIEFSGDVGFPVFRDVSKFLRNVYFFHSVPS